MSETILNKLREEHREAEATMAEINRTKDVVRKKELYLLLKEQVIPHMEGEEQTLYAHLIQDVNEEEAEEVAQHAEEEHDEVKTLFSRLDQIGIESDEWDSTFRKLCSCIQKHVEEEESALFAEAKEDFSREELIEFAEEFEEVKQHVPPS